MVIGFTERIRTVSESEVYGVDLFQLYISVATLRVSEREYGMLYRILSSSTATVVSFNARGHHFDARFGTVTLEETHYLYPGSSIIRPLVTAIRNDFEPEDEECYSIYVSPVEISGLRELIMCDYVDTSSNVQRNFFCEHTICIEDDDGKILCLSF